MFSRKFLSFSTFRNEKHPIRSVFALFAVIAGFGPLHGAYAQRTDQDRDALQHIGLAWTEGWNRHDMPALAALVAEDVEWTTATGARNSAARRW